MPATNGNADPSRRIPSGATPLAERIAALQRKSSSPSTHTATSPSTPATPSSAHLSPPSSIRSTSASSSAAAVKERIAKFQSRAGADERPLVPRSSFGAPGPSPSAAAGGSNVLRSFPAAQATGSGSGNWGEGVLRPQMTGGAWLGVGPSPSSLESGGHAIRPQMTGGVWGRMPSSAAEREFRRGASDSGYGSPSRPLGAGKDAFAELDADPTFTRGGQGRISPAPSIGRGPSPSPSKNPDMMRRGSSFSRAQIEAASSALGIGRSNGSSSSHSPARVASPPPSMRLTNESSSSAAAAAAAAIAARGRRPAEEAVIQLPSVPTQTPRRGSAEKGVMVSPTQLQEPSSAGDEERKETQLGGDARPIVIEVSGVSGLVTSRVEQDDDSVAVISSLPSVPRTPPRDSSLPLHPETVPSAGDVEIQIAGASPEQVAALRAKLAMDREEGDDGDVDEPVERPGAALGVYDDDDDDDDERNPTAGIGRLALNDAGDASASESGCSSIASPTKTRGGGALPSLPTPASPSSPTSSAAYRSVPADWATSSGWKAPGQATSDGTITASNSAATLGRNGGGDASFPSPSASEAAARAREAINLARSKSSTSSASSAAAKATSAGGPQRLKRPPPGKMLSAAELDASDDDYEPGWASVISSSRS